MAIEIDVLDLLVNQRDIPIPRSECGQIGKRQRAPEIDGAI